MGSYLQFSLRKRISPWQRIFLLVLRGSTCLFSWKLMPTGKDRKDFLCVRRLLGSKFCIYSYRLHGHIDQQARSMHLVFLWRLIPLLLHKHAHSEDIILCFRSATSNYRTLVTVELPEDRSWVLQNLVWTTGAIRDDTRHEAKFDWRCWAVGSFLANEVQSHTWCTLGGLNSAGKVGALGWFQWWGQCFELVFSFQLV